MPDEPTTPPQPPYQPPVSARDAQPIIHQRRELIITPTSNPVEAPTITPAGDGGQPSTEVNNTQSVAVASEPQPTPQTPMVPLAGTQESDKVWINKEEYLRLQQAERDSVAAFTGATKPVKFYDTFQIITTVIAALSLLAGLLMRGTGGAFTSIMVIPALVVLALLGAFTVNDKIQASKAGGYIKSHKGRNITLMVLAIIVFALPVLLPIGFILLMMIMCAGGGCKGS